ncbi:MAG: PLP-dependent aminotransferase family protein [Acidimicrobiales bacterium]|jgi:DNA-binding transcriptional MocR family regulator|nr:PLP-dependent aminotransferase family protein [Acidimicrobiales bacterium]
MLDRIEGRLEARTPDALAAAIGSLISEGVVVPGDKLPTVRSLAGHLEMSPNTVSDAWRILRSHGAIQTDRRRGTTVRGPRPGVAARHWEVPVAPGTIELDLSTGTPDTDLLPPLGPVLHRLHTGVAVTSYVDPPLLADLEVELRRRWPYVPDAVTVVDGALDALDRVVDEIVHLGDVVAVEDPTFPPLLDMLEAAGAKVIGVPLDDEGPDVEALRLAMEADPVALFTQPRAHNPTGAHTSSRRTVAIAEIVARTRCVVVEDDHSAGAAGVAAPSVGECVPERTLHIHSFSKSHGPDLRIAALGGPAAVIGNIVRRRQLGPSWTSRLIQQILLTMLTDPDIEALVEDAAETYRRRRQGLETLLAEHGVDVAPGVGLNLWIPVHDEQRAVVALAAHSVGVAPGRPFRVADTDAQHIRLSIGTLAEEDMPRVAAVVAEVAAAR